MKKLIPLLLCLCLLFSMMAGCSSSKIEDYDEGEAATETDATQTDAAEATGIALGGVGYAAYDPDTVVATVNGSDVTWMEYYYWLNYYTLYVQQLAAQYSATLSSWDANELAADATNEQVVLSEAQYAVVQYHVMETKAAELGLTLSETELADIASVYESTADSTSGDGDGVCTDEEKAAFDDYLAEQNVDKDFFDYLNEISKLNEDAFLQTYGENGSDYSDEDTLAYAEENGLMAAKHILLLTVDPSTGDALDDDAITEKETLINDLNDQLQAVADDQEAMIALFDELTAEYTEDTGYATYPDGYIFADGDLNETFQTTVEGLDVNYGLSGVVQSDLGYHIILRIPVNPDGIIGTDASGNAVSLRYNAANVAFSEEMAEWQNAADVQWVDGFESLSLLEIFG